MSTANLEDSSPSPAARRRDRGLTLVELMVAVAVVAILITVAVPEMSNWQDQQRVRTAARSVADAFLMARSEAIRTRSRHIVFFAAGAGVDPAPAGLDAASAALTNDAGVGVPILLVNDEASGAPNCRVDAGERVEDWDGQPGVAWGATAPGSTDRAPDDRPGTSGAIPTSGVAFYAPNGTTRVTWVAFSPDGVPMGFDAACNTGRIGTGGGTVYVTGSGRDYAVTLSPLGGVRVHGWNNGNLTWTQ